MCGIVGAYGGFGEELEGQLRLIAHRGPDGSGFVRRECGALGHARLAIVDVAGGRQPMSNPAATCWLVCNGEIYNHAELRAAVAGYPFQTRSDSEVILALYEWDGPEAVARLDGMFAFALLDEENGLLLARDPLGIKPLYYGWADGTLHFASEIKALQGVVDQVKEFPPGHWYSSRTGFVRYYDVIATANTMIEQDAATPSPEGIRAALRQAVHKRLMADVPLGVFLSGGLDSSIIAAMVRQESGQVHSFAVGMAGSDDLAYARQVAGFLGTRHHEYVYTVPEMIRVLPEVIYHLESFDPALVRSAVANYFLARLAGEHVTVVLSGEGADELYGGYRYLKAFDSEARLNQELVMITGELHNRNLQRLDRMTMAHGLEGRVPFLDVDFVELSFAVPVEQKIYGEEAVEKWALRQSCQDLLPDEVVWRPKAKFSKGAGSAYIFAALAEDEIDDCRFSWEARRIRAETGYRIVTKEELYYYRVFRDFFEAPVTSLVGQSRSL